MTVHGIERFSRENFLATRWRYKPGEHVTILGPTGTGKTWLAYQLLEHTATPQLPAVVIVMKPRDATAKAWSKKLDHPRTATWPPSEFAKIWRAKNPSGYTLWPKHTFDPQRDDYAHYVVFRKAILDCYKTGHKIIFADELYSLSDELGLDRELITVWTKGRSMDCGLWGATQKPSHVPLWAYSQAEHIFLHRDPDKRNQDRYGDIGGVDPRIVRDITNSLERHQWLYIRRDGPRMCIVDK